MFLEEYARYLLVAHTFFALATVALGTHLLFWLRPYLKGKFRAHRATKRFAILSASAYAITMLIGLLLYPTYRVRVRAEFLDNPSAITRGVTARAQARATAQRRNEESRAYRQGRPQPTHKIDIDLEEVAITADAHVQQGVRISRWFDVKEHWSTLGLVMAWALVLILVTWRPSAEQKAISLVVFGLAAASATTSWAAAIIGILTAAARSVAAL